MDKRAEFNDALKKAMKSKDEIALSTVRLILAALKDRDIAARGSGNAEGVGEAEILSMLQSMIKQRRESVEMYKQAGRAELQEREEAEIKVIERFMPSQLSDAEVEAAISDIISKTGAKDIRDMGKVMAALKTAYAGRMDMAKAGGIVKTKLG